MSIAGASAVKGPLAGIRIIEIAGLGAVPYAGMMLADMGAEVLRIERPDDGGEISIESPLMRNRRCLGLDLKRAAGRALLLSMAAGADALIEGFRPGVAERLGIGPEDCLARNARLVYGRLTGWGRSGPLAEAAGHDLNYIGLSGLLHQIGPLDGKPAVPLNVIGDFGGGGLLLAFGVLCALLEARGSGRGQVVDAAMLDGAVSFLAMSFGFRAAGRFEDRTGADVLAGAAPYYDVYETQDHRYVAVAAIEPPFFQLLLEKLGLSVARWRKAGYPALDDQVGSIEWPALKRELARVFRTRSRDEWSAVFAGADACVTPVLSLAEAAAHPHNLSRGAHAEVDGVLQNAPTPRFSRTPCAPPCASRPLSDDADAVLGKWGVASTLIDAARRDGALR